MLSSALAAAALAVLAASKLATLSSLLTCDTSGVDGPAPCRPSYLLGGVGRRDDRLRAGDAVVIANP
jgi:hypothetical protein